MNGNKNKNDTKRLAVCAMLAALGVVLLYLGAVLQVLDISMAVVASLTCVIAVIEYGKGAPWAIYGVTSILALILLPIKAPAIYYALFFGFYPILKEKFEKQRKLICWVLKEIVFNVCLVALGFITVFFATAGENELFSSYPLLAAFVALAEVVFVVYDIALTRLISFYIISIRNRLKF